MYVLESDNIADCYLYRFVRKAKERIENGIENIFSRCIMEEQGSQKIKKYAVSLSLPYLRYVSTV
jgi:hypothetical protein